MNTRFPGAARGLRNRLWAVIVLVVVSLLYISSADLLPQHAGVAGLRPLSRSILTAGMLAILLICLSGLAFSEKMKSLFIRDGLTGLSNRNYIRQRLEEEFYRSKRYSHPMSLMMIDLDNFKSLNDRFGHSVGDHLLRYFSQVIADTIRPSDIAARYNGEEFLIILPETHKEEARAVAERLRTRIALCPFRVDFRKEEVLFTISIGVTTYPEYGQSAEELVALADSALHQAKKDGKDKVAIYMNN